MKSISQGITSKVIGEMSAWRKRQLYKGKSFDMLFRVDGIPYGHFLSRFFSENVLPSVVSPYPELRKGKRLSIPRIAMMRSASFFLPRLLALSELNKMRAFPIKEAFNKTLKVLVLSYSNHLGPKGEIFRVQDLIDEINCHREDIRTIPFFVNPLTINRNASLRGKEVVYSYRNRKTIRRSLSLAGSMHKRWRSIPTQNKKAAFAKSGMWDYLKYAIDMYMSKEFIFLTLLYYSIFSRIIKEAKISAVVCTGVVGYFERCLLSAAYTQKAPAFVIQHGIGAENDFYNPGLLPGSRLLLFSKKYYEIYSRLGVPKEMLRVTGPVPYSRIRRDERAIKRVRDILVATSPLVEFQVLSKNEYFSRISRIMGSLSERYKLTFKLHPREIHKREYEKLALRHRDGAGIKIVPGNITGLEFYRLIAKHDLFIHFGSNSALEAMIIGRPTLDIDMVSDKSRRLDWLDDEMINKIRIEDNVLEKVRSLARQTAKTLKEQERIIRRVLGKVGENASARAASLILSSIRMKRKKGRIDADGLCTKQGRKAKMPEA